MKEVLTSDHRRHARETDMPEMFADTEDIAKVSTVRSNNELQLFGIMMTFYSNLLAFNYFILSQIGWLVSLFIQGKPLASGYYSRHPETTQYNKDKDKEKRKTEERTQKSKSTVAGENSKCSMQQLHSGVSFY